MVRRWLAGLCLVAGVVVLAGYGWALIVAAGVLYASRGQDPGVARVIGSVRGRLAAAGRWLAGGVRAAGRMAVVQRASLLLVAAGIAGVGVGLAVWVHPGAGVLAAGLASGAIGLRLERR